MLTQLLDVSIPTPVCVPATNTFHVWPPAPLPWLPAGTILTENPAETRRMSRRAPLGHVIPVMMAASHRDHCMTIESVPAVPVYVQLRPVLVSVVTTVTDEPDCVTEAIPVDDVFTVD